MYIVPQSLQEALCVMDEREQIQIKLMRADRGNCSIKVSVLLVGDIRLRSVRSLNPQGQDDFFLGRINSPTKQGNE